MYLHILTLDRRLGGEVWHVGGHSRNPNPDDRRHCTFELYDHNDVLTTLHGYHPNDPEGPYKHIGLRFVIQGTTRTILRPGAVRHTIQARNTSMELGDTIKAKRSASFSRPTVQRPHRHSARARYS
jgi:hypothetical protein